jgi:cell division protein FtsA
VAQRVLNVPARVAGPRELVGMVDSLRSPSFATSVGLLRWALSESNLYRPRQRQGQWGRRIGTFLRALLPD